MINLTGSRAIAILLLGEELVKTVQLQSTGVKVEDVAIAKADYFVKQKLGSDALYELYYIKPPPELWYTGFLLSQIIRLITD